MNKRVVSLLKILALTAVMLVLCIFFLEGNDKEGRTPSNKGESAYDFAMGTSISVKLYSSKGDAADVKKHILERIKHLDQDIISWRQSDSELGLLNNNYIKDKPYSVSEVLYTAISQAVDICKVSDGALDITIRPLARVWGIESEDEFIPPTYEKIQEALYFVGYENINVKLNTQETIKEYEGYITINEKDMIIDLGAVGKGYALDIIKDILISSEVDGGVVSVGGSIMVYGNKTDGSSWRIGIRDPYKDIYSEEMLGYLEFIPGTFTCISTSGGYEKYKEYEGKKYHHILDRNTGYPAVSDLVSVTVVCDNGLVSDGLSTACYVLGYEKSLGILKKYSAEAVFMDVDGNIIITEGLKDNWTEK